MYKAAVINKPWVPARTQTVARGTGNRNIVQTWLNDARIQGGADVYTGKRRHQRFRWNRTITLEINPGKQNACRRSVQAKDISKSGIGLRTREAVAPNTPVRAYIEDEDRFVEGRVRHSTSTIGAFIVGIEFE